MFLTSQQVVRMTEAELREFVVQGLPEGRHLDYKQALPGKSDDEQKREFLKDVTGFANAQGGHLVIGVDEPAPGLTVDEQIIGITDGDWTVRSAGVPSEAQTSFKVSPTAIRSQIFSARALLYRLGRPALRPLAIYYVLLFPRSEVSEDIFKLGICK